MPTPHGEAEVALDSAQGRAGRAAAGRTVGLLVLGHGASGGVDAPDLVAVRDAALAVGLTVARVTQPYRLPAPGASQRAPASEKRTPGAETSGRVGRRAPAPAAHLDAAFVACVSHVQERVGGLPLVVGGRSSGARVAARTAARLGAVGVLALAFPLHPPGRPDRSRAAELDASRPTLVVNGDADPFGVPEPGGAIRVVVRPGERHDLRRDPSGVADVAVAWLVELLSSDQARGAVAATRQSRSRSGKASLSGANPA